MPGPCLIGINMYMSDQQQNDTKKRMGRPATGQGTPVMVRLQPDMLDWLDAKRAAFDPELTRPQMMRRVLEEVMKAEAPIEPPAPKRKPLRRVVRKDT